MNIGSSTYLTVMTLIVVGAFFALATPFIATIYLYYKEKRLVFFKFISFKPEEGDGELENTLIRICNLSESISKLCIFLVLAILLYRTYTHN